MKKLIIGLLTLVTISAHAECVINTNSLHSTKTPGAAEVEKILHKKGYKVVKDEKDEADYVLKSDPFANTYFEHLEFTIWDSETNQVVFHDFAIGRESNGLFLVGPSLKKLAIRSAQTFPSCFNRFNN